MTLPDEIAAALEAGDTLVTPSPQRAVAVRDAWARRQLAEGRRVWPTPDVLHFDAWVERCLGGQVDLDVRLPRLLSAVEQQLAWRAASQAVAESESATLLGASRLADALRRADELIRSHEIPERRVSVDSGSEAVWLRLARSLVGQRLARLGARLSWHSVPALWPAFARGPRPVRFAGFDTFQPAQRRLIATVVEHGGSCAPLQDLAGPQSAPRCVAAADSIEELRRIAIWARQHLRRDPDCRLLVVLPDLDTRRAELERLLLDELDPAALASGTGSSERIAFEGGQPLASLPRVARDLTRLRRLIEPLEREDWLCWLRGFEAGSAADPRRVALEQLLLGWQGEALTLTALLQLAGLIEMPDEALPGWLVRSRRALRVLQLRSGPSAQWARSFDEALRLLDAESAMLDSAAWQTHERWQQLLADFAAAQTIAESLAARDALRQLRGLAQRTRFAPAAPATPLLLTAATADPIVRYDGIWVGGLHGAAFPRAARSEPFLPWALQREYAVEDCDPDALLARAQRELAAWRRCTSDLVLSFAREDNGAEQAASPLLQPWSDAAEPVTVADRPQGAATHLRVALGATTVMEHRDDFHGAALPTDGAAIGGTAVLTSLNQCAFRGYAELRLAAWATDQPCSGLDTLERGRLYHATLQRLWEQWPTSSALQAVPVEQRRAMIAAALRQAGRAVRPVPPTAVARRALEREYARALRLIDELLAAELQRPEFRALSTERQLPLRLGAAELQLRIDRIDELADGNLAVIDYKTGRGVPNDWQGDRPDTVQMLAYRAALQQLAAATAADGATPQVVALCYAQLSESRVGYRGVASQAEPFAPPLRKPRKPIPWSDRTAHWDRHLDWLGARLVTGEARVEPRPAACRNCDLTLLCRRTEQSSGVDEDEDSDSVRADADASDVAAPAEVE